MGDWSNSGVKPPLARPVNVLLCHRDNGQGQQGKLPHHVPVSQLAHWVLDRSPEAQPSFRLSTKPHLRQQGCHLTGLSKYHGGLGFRVIQGPPGETGQLPWVPPSTWTHHFFSQFWKGPWSEWRLTRPWPRCPPSDEVSGIATSKSQEPGSPLDASQLMAECLCCSCPW